MNAPPTPRTEHSAASLLLGWLPAGVRPRVLRRLLVVWSIALVIALILWGTGARSHPFDISLVYSLAISSAIWLLSDPLRIALGRWLGVGPPHYWAFSWRVGAYMLLSSTVGYALGTAVGDHYAGRSTWDMVSQSPARLLGFWVAGVGVSAFFVFGFYNRARADDLQRLATDARLKLLETQLEPHMLFNTLANLRALIATDPPRAIHMLDRLNDYLRATLKASRSDSGSHTLADEFARLRDYLELMAVRMGPRLRYTLDLPAALEQHPVPPLLLQPLVENAIRHGLEPQLDGGSIRVAASAHGAQGVLIDITDTGVGMDATAAAGAAAGTMPGTGQGTGQGADKSTGKGTGQGTGESTGKSTNKGGRNAASGGFGLAQVRERLATAYPGQGSLQLQSTPGQGTRISLQLPAAAPAGPAVTAKSTVSAESANGVTR